MPEFTALRGRAASPQRSTGVLWMVLMGLLAGVLAFAALISAHEANPKYVFVVFGGALLLMVLPLVRDLRVFCLDCLLVLAPLGLRLSFFHHPHMGGAGAINLEAVDPFIALLLYFQVRDRIRGQRDTFRFPLALVLWAALIVIAIVAMAFSDFRTLAGLEIVRMIKVLALALVVTNEVVRKRQFKHVVVALTVGVILQTGIALLQTARGAQIGLRFFGESSDEDVQLLGETSLESGEFVYRAGGLLGHANFLAAYIALLLPMCVALVLSPGSRLLKALSLVAIMTGLPALVLTLSRAGWVDFSVALAIALLLGAMNTASRRRFLFARISIMVAVVVVAIAASPVIIKRLTDADPNSVKFRLEWIQTAKAMVIDNPVWGVGLNSYVYRSIPYGRYKTPAEMTEVYGDIWPVVHNSWMIIWSEQGTVGMAIWIAFHLAVIAVAIRNLRIREPMLHAMSVGLLAGFIAIMIDGLASFFVRQEATSRMFWVATATILAIGYWRRINEEGVAPAAMSEASRPAQTLDLERPLPEGRWLPARKSPLQ